LRYLKTPIRFGYRQLKNLIKLLLGQPINYHPLGSQTLDLDDVKIARYWLKQRNNWYNTEIIEEYEKEFAHWNGSKYAFAFMGGRVALSACVHALKLKAGDEVILPGYTCVVVPNAFHFAGVKTIFSDIELDTYGLDASLIEQKMTPRTKAILLHHIYGIVCRDYEKIINIAREKNLYVIEDCAQSTGAVYKNRKIGNFGDVAIYSSEQSKVFTTIQGGIAVTNDDTIAEGLKDYYDKAPFPTEDLIDKQLHCIIINYHSYKDAQRWWKGDFYRWLYRDKIIVSTTKEEMRGIKPNYYGCKMPAPFAAIGLNQLKKIDRYNELRRETAKLWDKWCEEKGYKKPMIVPDSVPVFLRYPVLVEPDKKKNTSWASKEFRVELGVWFETNIHPADWPVEGCPNADKAVSQCINFPGLLL